MYWVIRRWPSSPSFCSCWRFGKTGVSTCRMIDAVMYGMIPSANTRQPLQPAAREQGQQAEHAGLVAEQVATAARSPRPAPAGTSRTGRSPSIAAVKSSFVAKLGDPPGVQEVLEHLLSSVGSSSRRRRRSSRLLGHGLLSRRPRPRALPSLVGPSPRPRRRRGSAARGLRLRVPPSARRFGLGLRRRLLGSGSPSPPITTTVPPARLDQLDRRAWPRSRGRARSASWSARRCPGS